MKYKEFREYLRLNDIGLKEDELKDYKKAKEYISWIIEEMEE